MRIYINNQPVYIIDKQKKINKKDYDVLISAGEMDEVVDLEGKVLVETDFIDQVFYYLHHFIAHEMVKVSELTFLVSKKKKIAKKVKKEFKLREAAGGIVEKDGKVLMILRLKKWDLPKGKLEKGETFKEAAVREVEEECNIKVELKEKIGITWHYYVSGGYFKKQKKNLKKTKWYRMKCIDDTEMKPQRKEGIVKVKWMSKKETAAAFDNSYESIRYIMGKYYAKMDKKAQKTLHKTSKGKKKKKEKVSQT